MPHTLKSRVGAIVALTLVIISCIVVSFSSVASSHQPELIGTGTSIRNAPSLPVTDNAPATGKERASSFSISGRVAGLYPGAIEPLALTVSNPNKFAIVVTSITTSVGDATSQCRAAAIQVSNFSGALRVDRRSSGTVEVSVTMAHGVPNACQGAIFPFRYSGVATHR